MAEPFCLRLQARCEDVPYDHRCRPCPTIAYIEKGITHEAEIPQAPGVDELGTANLGGLAVVPPPPAQAGTPQVTAPIAGVSLLDDKTVSPDTLPTYRKDAP
jgi:hypothetical protein